MSTSLMRDPTLRLLSAICVAAIIAVVLIAVAAEQEQEKHGGCAESVQTGGLTCWGSESWKHCEPDTRCVRYGDGTVPR